MAGNVLIRYLLPEDLEVGMRYVGALRANGLKVWVDARKVPKDYAYIVLVSQAWSREAGSGQIAQFEADCRLLPPRQIVVVRSGKSEVPPQLAAYTSIDVPAIGFKQAIEELVRRVSLPAHVTSVFISYSREDAVFMMRLADALRAAGINRWIDHERLRPGTLDWEREIRRGITSSNGVIYIGSEDAADSTYVRSELAIARDNSITVYPIWARGEKWSRCAPLSLGSAQYADARGDKFDSAVQSIIASLNKASVGN